MRSARNRIRINCRVYGIMVGYTEIVEKYTGMSVGRTLFRGFEGVEKGEPVLLLLQKITPSHPEMSSRESKDRKGRKPNGGPSAQSSSSAGNEQVLQDIRVTLAASRKSVTPSPVRETATPSPVTMVESSSPGSSRVKSRPSPVESVQRHRHGEQMARIRDNLKPHHKSDPGFNYSPDTVDQEMLQDLIMKGYDQVRIERRGEEREGERESVCVC